ncbi:MAG: PBP1A family penicillin-binding protein [Chloroflexi bacterium]|nr:PBP1A family penicillin-binding protein [Chloroflexota bacterium]
MIPPDAPGARHGSHRPTPPLRLRRSSGGRLIAVLLVALALMGALLGLLVSYAAVRAATAYQQFARDLPSVSGVDTRPIFKTTRILDRNGRLIYELFDPDQGKRTVVRLAELPPEAINAFVAVEDASFYDNPGIDPRGILRALLQDIVAGEIVEGGSTITQQLIRNVLFTDEERYSTTVERKLKEAVLSMELSRSYSKHQILEMYLNEIYFGNFSYGIETAARTYFDKSARDVNLAEAALLAGLPQAPSRYDPFTNFELTKRRQENVLDVMVRNGFVTRAEAEAAKAEPLYFTPPDRGVATQLYPHWGTYIRSSLQERYGPRVALSSGLTVHTTLDSDLQDLAEAAVRQHIADLSAQGATNAALVALDPRTGEILAIVGSPDFYNTSIDGQVNAALVERQPGSSIKPIVYLSAFIKGFSPATVVMDEPIAFAESNGRVWQPKNFDDRFRGPVTLRRALGNSLNIPAVKVLQYAGLPEALTLARKMGMTSLRDPSLYGLAFTLGGGEVRLLELVSAYGVLANGGVKAQTFAISKVVDAEGSPIDQHQTTLERVADPRFTFLVTDILSDNTARLETFGANSPLRLSGNRPAAAKTGSTDDYRDSWTVGYTPSLVTGVWVGRADNQPMRLVLGSSGAGRIWNTFMERALEGTPPEAFPVPAGAVRGTVCAADGRPPTEDCERTVTDWFIQERTPRSQSQAIAIDRVTGKLAGQDTPYQDVIFQRFDQSASSGEGPFAPTEYSTRTGATRAWERAPATLLPTVLSGAGAPRSTPTPLAAATPTPTTSPTIPPVSAQAP